MKTFFKLGDERLEIEFDPHKICAQYNKLIRALVACERTKNAKDYGRLTVELMQLIMGDKTALKVLQFYEGNTEKLINDMVIFLGWRIAPIMRNASKENLKSMLGWWKRDAHRKAGDSCNG